jgi:tetratricopeptide (TPR) repeat protein
MFYLIVPPIIIVLAIAILIIFLVRILSLENKGYTKTVGEKKVKEKFKKSRNFFQNKGDSAKQRIKKTIETTATVLNEKKNRLKNTEGITRNGKAINVVSLRKKSMISDKIDDGEERDVEEMSLMKKIESDPQNSKKYERLGDYYMEHEKFDDARECYKYVLRLDPRHKRAQVAMRNLDRVLR